MLLRLMTWLEKRHLSMFSKCLFLLVLFLPYMYDGIYCGHKYIFLLLKKMVFVLEILKRFMKNKHKG